MWHVYLLWNPKTNRTYIGSTTDYRRRLRQHNREIQGGAKYTEKGAPHWTLKCVLTGFENQSIACRWEKLLKLRSRGLTHRGEAFYNLYKGICPEGKKHYEPPINLTIEVYP